MRGAELENRTGTAPPTEEATRAFGKANSPGAIDWITPDPSMPESSVITVRFSRIRNAQSGAFVAPAVIKMQMRRVKTNAPSLSLVAYANRGVWTETWHDNGYA
jgi:hypothetical protein